MEIAHLIEKAASSPLYASLWEDVREYHKLPVLTPAHIRSAERFFPRGQWISLDRAGHRIYFTRSLDDLAHDAVFPLGVRPLVHFQTSQNNLVWSLRAIARGSVPLVRERSAPLTRVLAHAYRITDLITDAAGYAELRDDPSLSTVERIYIIESNPAPLSVSLPSYVQRIWALEETGPLGEIDPAGRITYFPDVLHDTETLTIARPYGEPLIRYAPFAAL